MRKPHLVSMLATVLLAAGITTGGLAAAGPARATGSEVTLNPTADSYVNTGNPDTNHGTETVLDASATAYRTLMKYDMSVLPPGSVITAVTLKLYSTNAPASGGYEVHPEGDSWTETGVTWNNQPTWDTTVLGTSATPATNSYTSVTLPVSAVSTSGNTDLGVRFSVSGWVQAASSRETANKPQLIIDYTPPVTQSGPFMTGNLLSFSNSDFEGAANYVPVSNAAITDSTAQAWLHTHSLADTAAAAGTSSFKLGHTDSVTRVNLTGGATYTLGGYFKTPAQTGGTVFFSLGCYDSSDTWLGWTDGSSLSLGNQSTWQYREEQLTIPASCSYALGSPKVTLGGVTAGQVTYLDEFTFKPYRAAQAIGFDAGMSGDSTLWNSANSTIGPGQEDKVFYSGQVPASYTGSKCATLPAGVTCVLAYKTQNTNLASYIAGIPADRTVVFVYHQEPEGDYASGSTFVSEFEGQATAIRSDSGNAPNVLVADDAASYPYNAGQPGYGCSYIVPPSYVDWYLVDHYQPTPNGNSMPTGMNGDDWQRWMTCVQGAQPTGSYKPIGLGEYGLGTCGTNGNTTRLNTIAADQVYLKGLPATFGAPIADWNYWWVDDSASNPCSAYNFTDSATITQWKSGETANGGGTTP